MQLSDLVRTSQAVAATRGRNAKVDRLAELLARLRPPELPVAVAYLVGLPRQGRLGLGIAAVRAARPDGSAVLPRLAVREVDGVLEEVAAAHGLGAEARRIELFRGLLERATASEQDFLIRLVLGELRQGALEGVMQEAIARAAGLPAERVRQAVMLAGDPAPVAEAALAEGEAGLARFRLEVFHPVKPMLAQGAEDLAEALARLGEAALEVKLDGARVQVHKAGPRVRVYSRRLNDVTAALPEVVEAVRSLPLDEAVLDGETIALDPDGRPLPFQATMRRFGRRQDVDELRRELPLTTVFFDCLYLEGDDLLGLGEAERFAALAERLPAALVIERRLTADEAEARAFLDEALGRGHEGLVAKDPAAPYAAGARGAAWLKVKAARTLDLVVLAAEWGHGRRRGWLSNLHLGAYDPDSGGYVMLGKTFKGMTDAMLDWQTARLRELAIGRGPNMVRVRPALVAEVAFDGVQASPHYPGGLVLRFARIKRYREDKGPEEADTIEAVRAIHQGAAGER